MSPKTIFLSAFFLFASALCLQAQGTYEYGAITYSLSGKSFYIGISTTDNYVETEVKSKFNSKINWNYFSDLTPLIQKVNELTKDGWEVFSTSQVPQPSPTSLTGSITYHLRRKKP